MFFALDFIETNFFQYSLKRFEIISKKMVVISENSVNGMWLWFPSSADIQVFQSPEPFGKSLCRIMARQNVKCVPDPASNWYKFLISCKKIFQFQVHKFNKFMFEPLSSGL
jgi:hypothetical protein